MAFASLASSLVAVLSRGVVPVRRSWHGVWERETANGNDPSPAGSSTLFTRHVFWCGFDSTRWRPPKIGTRDGQTAPN